MEPQKVTYYNEISLMMFGFGDSHKPNPETVRLIESIVLKQLHMIIQEAMKYWDGKTLKGEELVFLMRKNKWKMRRFLKYLHLKEIRKNLLADPEDEDVKLLYRPELFNFIEKIDETGELMDLREFDKVKHKRQLRANRISLILNDKKYLEFQRARCVSFNNKDSLRASSMEKLRSWIDPKKEINISNNAMELLSYYAYQTVAEIIDDALLARMDTQHTDDPLRNLIGKYYTAAMFVGEHRFGGPNPDYSRVYSGQPPISVAEIKEVLRRVNSPQTGKLMFGRKLSDTQYLFAL